MTGCGEEKGKAGDADLWKNLGRVTSVNVERNTGRSGGCQGAPHRDKKDMSHFEKFVTKGNDKADELAKEGAFLDEGFMAQTRAKTVKQEPRRGVRSLAVCGQFSLSGVKSSSRKKGGFLWKTKERKQEKAAGK